jgi:hypothetical protein
MSMLATPVGLLATKEERIELVAWSFKASGLVGETFNFDINITNNIDWE